MLYRKLFSLRILCLLVPGVVLCQSKDTTFSFTLNNSSRTSAGVYKPDGTLVRTLWSGMYYNAGTYKLKWDGTDDAGIDLPDASYTTKVLSNNVGYQWEGVIGNTSDNVSGATKHHSLDIVNSMAISGNTAYTGAGYSEGNTSEAKFNLSTPQQKTLILPYHGTSQSSFFTATDGINAYWAGNDPFAGNKWFVIATKISNDTETVFSSGSPLQMTYGRRYASVINYLNNAAATITGLAVQRTRNFLFVSHKDLNEIHVLNKTSGALVKIITTFMKPRFIAIDGNDNLWVISGANTVAKYAVNATTGALTSLNVSLPAMLSPLSLSVSYDNNYVVVADGGPSQQLKAYGNNTGSSLWTYGSMGGYATDPIVADNKFYFSDFTTDVRIPFICFQSDGSFWVSDPGNFRIQHYASNRTFINRIMYLPRNYSVYVDRNNPTRVFSEYLEFAIDYSKPLDNGMNGSWKLVRNWRGAVKPEYFNGRGIFRSVTTLSNGRTYGLLSNTITNKPAVVELPSTGAIRFTGIELAAYSSEEIYPDGSLRSYSGGFDGILSWHKKLLTQFDASHNPIWASPKIISSTTATTHNDPVPGSGYLLPPVEITSSDVIVSFQAAGLPYGSSGYHLGGLKVGENKWLWKTALGTHKDYNGDFPSNGDFDLGNGSQYLGNIAMAIDRSIIWGYNGEFWKGGQTNKWNHVYDNGLFLGQFGTTHKDVDKDAPAMMAGNAFSPSLVKVGNDFYLYHNDESYHGGVHRWKITGLNTIREQAIALDNSFSRTSELDSLPGIDLMKGLPFNAVLQTNTNGWTRNPTEESNTGFKEWNAKTSVKTYKKRQSPDLWVKYAGYASPSTISRYLGSHTNLSSWKLSGTISYEDNMPNSDHVRMYLDVLDNAGKILTRFYTTITFGSPDIISIYANNKLIVAGKRAAIETVTDALQPINISMSDSKISVAYGNYAPVTVAPFDATGNLANPAIMRLYFDYNSGGNVYGKFIDLNEMRFVAKKENSGNQAPVSNSGIDKTISLPVNDITLNGSGTDADGTVSNYKWTQVSGPNNAIFSNSTVAAPMVSGLIEGLYKFSLVVTDNLQLSSAPDEMILTVKPASTTGTPIYRINAGGVQITHSTGIFSADTYFSPSPGDTYSTTSAIAGTTDDAIYQSERSGGTGTFNYAFPVSNGEYTVVLHFAEIYHTGIGNRIFDVSIEAAKVLNDFDIIKKVGSFTATTETFTTNVTDGTLNIKFSSLAADGGRDRAKVSAIEILRNPGNQALVTAAEPGGNSSRDEPLKQLTATVQPNPGHGHFNFYVNGNDNPVGVTIFSVGGQFIEARANIFAGSIFTLGNNYTPGLYYAIFQQGVDRVILRFIKQHK